MRYIIFLLLICLRGGDENPVYGNTVHDNPAHGNPVSENPVRYFPPDDPAIQYMGRFDPRHPGTPRCWAPGSLMRVRFSGFSCRVLVRDEMLYGKSHNYLEIIVDEGKPLRIRTRGRSDTLLITGSNGRKEHMVTVCKDTEAGIGYLEFAGLLAEGLLPPPPRAMRKIEFIGNSITCGTGMDLSEVPCGQGEWYDQHNAWMSYGPLVSRALGAQWQLSAVSGIGLIHSCCHMTVTMPEVFDKVDQRDDSIAWDFSLYQPDVVTVCLGQNDGVQDSLVFCAAYIRFLGTLRHRYPGAQIVCLTSPMGETALTDLQKRYLSGIEAAERSSGELKVHTYFYSKRYSRGCGGHPDLDEHRQIAEELTGCIKKIMGW